MDAYLTDEERAERLRKLLALEVARVLEDLELRRDLLLELWGRTRDRSIFLDTVHSRWKTLGFPELTLLETETVAALDTFFRELEELRFYFRFTEDMPVHLADTYELGIVRLEAVGRYAIDALGGVPELPMIEFPEDLPEAAEEEEVTTLETTPSAKLKAAEAAAAEARSKGAEE